MIVLQMPSRAILCAAVFVLPVVAAEPSAASTEVALYRVFLRDGSDLVSYGEYTRVGDQVVLSLPLAAGRSDPPLHLVTVPADVVDWPRTERYTQSVRYQQYTATRGEMDFLALSSDVAQGLNEIAGTADPTARLRLAVGLHRAITEWPQHHFGYRSGDVRQIAGMVEEVVAELSASTGGHGFDLSLVAIVEPPPPEPLVPAPSLQQLIANALSAARLTRVPAERMSMLQSVIELLRDPSGASLPTSWASRTGSAARRELAAELGIERTYTALVRSAVRRATAYAARGDVRGVESVLQSIRARDAAVGRKRPNEIGAVLASLEAKLHEAQRLRLEIDRWSLRAKAYQSYARAVESPMRSFAGMKPWLEDIRALAGPEAGALDSFERRVDAGLRALDDIDPPPELAAVHGLFTEAGRLARQAVDVRRQAILSRELQTAWSAASAASGALMLFTHAQAELASALRRPQLR